MKTHRSSAETFVDALKKQVLNTLYGPKLRMDAWRAKDICVHLQQFTHEAALYRSCRHPLYNSGIDDRIGRLCERSAPHLRASRFALRTRMRAASVSRRVFTNRI